MEFQTPKARPRWQLPFVGVVLIGLLALAIFALPRVEQRGDLPEAQLVKLDGTSAHLETGKPTVVTVWATWCTYCQRQLPQFEAVAKKRSNVNFAFVNDGEPPDLVRQFHNHFGLNNAVVYQDALRTVSSALKVNGYPANFFYDSRGKLVGQVRGYMTGEQLEAALAQIN